MTTTPGAFAAVTGVSPVLEVPFTAQGDVDEDGFRRIVVHTMQAGASSVMFPGFASEYYKLEDIERRRLIGLLLEISENEGVPVIVSVPEHATKLAVRRAREAVERGAAGINILPPHLMAPGPDEVRQHVSAVLDAVPDTPAVIQYAPAQTGTAFDASTIRNLAARHRVSVQVKVEAAPPGPMVTALAAGDPSITSVVGYGGLQLPDALRRGAVGVQPGCSFTEIYVTIWRLWGIGRADEAVRLHRRLLPFLSYWMQHVELIIQAEKTISARRGIIESDHCRAPRRPLDAYETAMIDEFLDEFADILPPAP